MVELLLSHSRLRGFGDEDVLQVLLGLALGGLVALIALELLLTDLRLKGRDGHVDILEVGLRLALGLVPALGLVELFLADSTFCGIRNENVFEVRLGFAGRRLGRLFAVELFLAVLRLGIFARLPLVAVHGGLGGCFLLLALLLLALLLHGKVKWRYSGERLVLPRFGLILVTVFLWGLVAEFGVLLLALGDCGVAAHGAS